METIRNNIGETKMKTLIKHTGYGDQVNTFGVRVKPKDIRSGMSGDGEMITFDLSVKTVCLMQDYEKVGDGIYWGMADTIMLKDSYTQADRDEKKRIREEEPVEHGDIVIIDGDKYQARVLGDFSNCVVFDRI
jgi:hypothetical protein